MPIPEFEPEPAYTQGGNPNALENYLERSIRSSQSAQLAAEFHLKTTSRLNLLKRRELANQVKKARREVARDARALGNIQIQLTANEASASLD